LEITEDLFGFDSPTVGLVGSGMGLKLGGMQDPTRKYHGGRQRVVFCLTG